MMTNSNNSSMTVKCCK